MLVLSSGLEPMHVRIGEAVAHAVQGKCKCGERVIVQHAPRPEHVVLMVATLFRGLLHGTHGSKNLCSV